MGCQMLLVLCAMLAPLAASDCCSQYNDMTCDKSQDGYCVDSTGAKYYIPMCVGKCGVTVAVGAGDCMSCYDDPTYNTQAKCDSDSCCNWCTDTDGSGGYCWTLGDAPTTKQKCDKGPPAADIAV